MTAQSRLDGTARRIAVIGAGFTGSVLVAHLLREATSPIDVTLIEQSGDLGKGLAYSTPNSTHLLNVRASNMSAFPADPGHFLSWLWANDGENVIPPSGHGFVSRGRYGDYIRAVLDTARQEAPAHVDFRVIHGGVTDLVESPDGVSIQIDGGDLLAVDQAVLCIGHFPPSIPAAVGEEALASGAVIADPWDLSAVAAIPRDGHVMIIGTGLTMVDTVLTLLDQGHQGAITATSRRGLLPLVHVETRPFKSFLSADVSPGSVLDVMIALRADVRRAREEGLDWRSAFDALRSHHHRIWRNLPLDERRRFLRHARPYWEVHRHRMAPQVASRIEAALASGQLRIRPGRLETVVPQPDGSGLSVCLRPREGEAVVGFDVDAVINACGPECDLRRVRHPLVRQLLDRGLVRPDALRLGLDVTDEGAVISGSGIPSTRLFVGGPAAKAPFWEMTAVPELRGQCARLAGHLLEQIHA